MNEKLTTEKSHQEAWELLPWYVTHTLEPVEQEQVEAHVRQCKACSRELQAQRSLASFVHHSTAPSVPPTAALEKVMARIEAFEQASTTTAAGANKASVSAFRQRVSQIKRDLTTRLGIVSNGTRWLFAAQTAVIFFLVSVILLDAFPSRVPTTGYETLSNAASSRHDSNQFRVLFTDNSRAKDIRETLRSIQGEIVQGPSGMGVYTVAVPAQHEVSQPLTAKEIVKRLRASAVVQFAEAIDGPTAQGN